MLLGEHAQPVSDASQLVLPQQVIAALGEELVITRGFERNLLLFPKMAFEALANKLLEKPLSKLEVRALRRRLFSAATELVPDEKGRVKLPRTLLEFAGIEGEAILAGMYEYAEIWSSDRWQPAIEAATADADNGYWEDLGI